MSSAPDAPRQVSWLSFRVLSISVARASARAPDCSSQCSAGWGAEMRAAAGLACAGLRRHVAVRHESAAFALDALVRQKKLRVSFGQDYLAV